ncbi:MAG: hypothetical protein JSS66_07630 [Armatimonadetes bacterium]|nr:hypothetical protein [Armatimonadota bacterium]
MFDAELEQHTVYVLFANFAAQLENDPTIPVFTCFEDDYYLVARKRPQGPIAFDVDLWRTSEFVDHDGVMFALSHAPGMVTSKRSYNDWNSVPVNNHESSNVFGPMWGVTSLFVYPDDLYELEAFCDRSKDAF